MSSVFSQATPSSSHQIEATVLSVDTVRDAYTVKTVKGQRYRGVLALSMFGGYGRATHGFSFKVGDQVLLSTALGYPVILGAMPRIDRDPVIPVAIDPGGELVDLGNLTSMTGSSLNSGRPRDFVAGDVVFTTEGGGLLGALRSGTVLMKASKMAQVIVSKLDDGVKVVGRSLDLYSEVGSEVFASVKGRVYKWVGLARTPAEARQGLFRYQEFYGDTAAAEQLRDNYELGAVGASVSSGGPLRKVLIVDGQNLPVRIEETDLDGNVTSRSQTPDGVSTSTVACTSGSWDLNVANGVFCKITVVNESVFITYNGESNLELNGEKVSITKGPCEFKVTDSQISLEVSGRFLRVTSAGIETG